MKDAVERVSPFGEDVVFDLFEIRATFEKVIDGAAPAVVKPVEEEPVEHAFAIAVVRVCKLLRVGLALLIELSLKSTGGYKLDELASEVIREQELTSGIVLRKR